MAGNLLGGAGAIFVEECPLHFPLPLGTGSRERAAELQASRDQDSLRVLIPSSVSSSLNRTLTIEFNFGPGRYLT